MVELAFGHLQVLLTELPKYQLRHLERTKQLTVQLLTLLAPHFQLLLLIPFPNRVLLHPHHQRQPYLQTKES